MKSRSALVNLVQSWKDNWLCLERKVSVLDFRLGTVLKIKREQNTPYLLCAREALHKRGRSLEYTCSVYMAEEYHRVSVVIRS